MYMYVYIYIYMHRGVLVLHILWTLSRVLCVARCQAVCCVLLIVLYGMILVSVTKTEHLRRAYRWKTYFKEHQIRGWMAASAAGLQGKG